MWGADSEVSSVVGGTDGHVVIQAVQNYPRVGSDVLALQDNIDIAAQRVDIGIIGDRPRFHGNVFT